VADRKEGAYDDGEEASFSTERLIDRNHEKKPSISGILITHMSKSSSAAAAIIEKTQNITIFQSESSRVSFFSV
jgi:hypothetical protein